MAEGEQQPSKDQEKGTWQYKPESSDAPLLVGDSGGGAPASTEPSVEWTASEFIAHPKNPMWYVVLAALTVLVAAGLYLITRDTITVIVIALLGLILGVTAARQPRIMTYRLDHGGLTAGKRFHPYGNFKSFAVVDEGAFASITLLPMKRFMLPLNIYFSPDDEHKILEVLSRYLPLQQGALDSLDRMMRSLHF